MYSGRSFPPHVIVTGVAIVMLLVSVGVYGMRSQPYTLAIPPVSTEPAVINAEVLQNWLPASSYTYTIARINDYLAQNRVAASSMVVTGDVATQGSGYQFTVELLPSKQTLTLLVHISNYSPIISTAVSINGKLQAPTFNPSQSTTFAGITDLINSGVTTTEANNLQAAFTKFAPSAGNISIDPSSITHVRVDSSSPDPDISYTFLVKINNTAYTALIHCPDLDSVQLILTQGNHRIFDSGVINSQG